MVSYHGGKQRIASKIAHYIATNTAHLADDRGLKLVGYCEPFCGMASVLNNMIDHAHSIPESIPSPKSSQKEWHWRAGDINESVIKMWKKAQQGKVPDMKEVTTKNFYRLKGNGKSSATKGFVGHFFGYRGAYFVPIKLNITSQHKKNMLTKVKHLGQKMKSVEFLPGDYTQFSKLKNHVIFADPPFENNSHYYTENHDLLNFDHEAFWDWCRKMSKHNLVFVCEENAPKDFVKLTSIDNHQQKQVLWTYLPAKK
jgi:site-specific DNA-adenine methylase